MVQEGLVLTVVAYHRAAINLVPASRRRAAVSAEDHRCRHADDRCAVGPGMCLRDRGLALIERSGCAPSRRFVSIEVRFGRASSCMCSSVAEWQSIRLLTGWLQVRIQPEEPI